MTPEEKQLLKKLSQDVEKIKEYTLQGRGSLEFVNTVRNLVTGEGAQFTVKGQLIAQGQIKHTGTTLGFLGATPVVQQSSIADPSGGTTVDSQARTAVISILDVLDAFGFTA